MRFIKFFFIIVALCFLQSCSKTSLYQSKHYVFGTIVDISIYGEDEKKAEEATQAVLHEFTRLHNSLHAWKKSDVTNLNEAIAKNKPYINPSIELTEILKEAKVLEDASNHLFNPAIGELIDYWGFHQDEFNPIHPDKSKITSLSIGVDFVGFRNFYHYRLLGKRNIRNMERKISNFTNNEINKEKMAEIFQGWNAYAKWADSYGLRKGAVGKIYL